LLSNSISISNFIFSWYYGRSPQGIHLCSFNPSFITFCESPYIYIYIYLYIYNLPRHMIHYSFTHLLTCILHRSESFWKLSFYINLLLTLPLSQSIINTKLTNY
jgi:hypothetical protein